MNDWDALLRQLSDNPDEDYERDGGSVILVRHGQETLLSLKTVPGIGVAVEMPGSQDNLVPVAKYVQKELLGLQRLAGQIVRTLERAARDRPAPFIEGPAECFRRDGKEHQAWEVARAGLGQHLVEKEAGTTRLVQLMAPAGQGKTVLLEQIALENAKAYKPDAFPVPLLLPVDLLGRFVGSIADAIAGSLNNTYTFPNLTQRDVIECIRQGWLILALDGFDELVARVGSRDAFLAISALLEQLHGSGAVVISARETFFDLYQITAAIRTYLKTNQGSYDVSRVKLLPWSQKQGINVFRTLGSPNPEADLDALRSVFDGDDEIVFQPFFLTRLASLWQKGERFGGVATSSGRLGRIHYVIETFIQRESTEKWRDRDGNPLLSAAGHSVMLASVAEEMWRSSAFRLQPDELTLAAELGILRLGLTGLEVDKIKALIPTHAVISSADRSYTFRHDRFFDFFLAYGIALHLHHQSMADLRAILEARELGPEVLDWIVWHSLRLKTPLVALLRFLETFDQRSGKGALKANIATILAKYLPYLVQDAFQVGGFTFAGDVFAGNHYRQVEFDECNFWTLDLCGTTFEKCLFLECSFGDIRIDGKAAMPGSEFQDCRFVSIDVSDDQTSLFTPAEIEAQLKKIGATIKKTRPPGAPATPGVSVSQKAINAVERYVRCSMSTCDVAIEDLDDRFGELAEKIAKIGVKTGVMREVSRPTSGPKKTLVRFQVDRDRLRRGHQERTGEPRIDSFWTEVARQFPA
jgi:hypothetical protein